MTGASLLCWGGVLDNLCLENMVTSGEVDVHQHPGIEGNSPCPATLISAATGPPYKGSVGQCHIGGIYHQGGTTS